MFKAYKYRIYPTKEQQAQIENTFNSCRFLFNLALETKEYAFRQFGVNLNTYELQRQIVGLKEDNPWLKEACSQSLKFELIKLEDGYTRFFKGKSRFPRFKHKNHKQSFTSPHRNRVDVLNKTLTVPKIKDIPVVLSRNPEGEIKTVTISKSPTGKYYASVLVDNYIDNPPKSKPTNFIGIDLGISDFAIMSNGKKIPNPRFLKSSLKRLKVLQARASKKVKGSMNNKKALQRVSILHEKINNQRTDFLQKLSSDVIHDNQMDTICIENLAVKNMVKNHCLAQAISDVSWSRFNKMLAYKAEWYGKNIVTINRFDPSSKKCSGCGFLNYDMPLSIREWVCPGCGVSHDRDVNAAINIRNSGQELSGAPVEKSAIVGSKKQESKFNREAKGF